MRYCLLLLLLVATTVFAQTEEEFRTLEERGYGIYLPSGYDGESELPLVVALHGFGDEWRNFSRYSGFITIAEAYNFIVAFPNGYLRQWNDGSVGDHYEDDVRMLAVMIERVARDYRINRERVYLVGFSNGGTMVYKAACEAPELFAGIAAVGGTMRSAQRCPDYAQMPVLVIHGTADAVVPFNGGDGRYSAPNTAAFWVEQNGCSTEGVPDFAPENGTMAYHFADCPDGNQVLLYVLEDLGHSWFASNYYANGEVPPAALDTPRWIWSFFELSYLAKTAETVEATAEATSEATEAP